MSYSFRERIKLALKKDLKEKLSLTQEEVDWINENMKKGICAISDEVANAMKNNMPEYKGKSLDEIIDMMSEEEFEDFVREVLQIAKKRLNYKKKKKKQQESESDSESDRESDSDTEGSQESEQTQEKEQECAT